MHYSFTLYVVKGADNSVRARKNLKHLCEKWISGSYEIKVVNVLEDFQAALDNNILLTPSVVVTEPKPEKIIHGDLSDDQKFIEALNLDQQEKDDK